LLVFVSLLAHELAAQRVNPDSAVLSHTLPALDSLAADHARTGRFSGVILVGRIGPSAAKGGSALFLKAYGPADRDAHTPNRPATPFITASTAKSFTAVGVSQLIERQKVVADSPVSSYLPDSVFPTDRARRISVSALLTHTAGLGDVITSRAFRSDPSRFTQLDQLVQLVRETPPLTDPGPFHYADGDYVLLGAIIERVSGEPFADYMRDHVFRPAGMTQSGFQMWPRPSELAHGYTARNIGGPSYTRVAGTASNDSAPALHANDVILPHVGVPGAVAYTTAVDLMHFADGLARHTLLDAARTTALWTGRVETGQEGPNRQYGYGFFVGTDSTVRIINHGGTGPGIDNAFDIYPDQGYVVVILANLDPPAAQDIRAFLRAQFAKLEE
jgi:CubicO group peptidase (beta-lactamase class C family)